MAKFTVEIEVVKSMWLKIEAEDLLDARRRASNLEFDQTAPAETVGRRVISAKEDRADTPVVVSSHSAKSLFIDQMKNGL